MNNFEIYNDIAKRTGGDIYVGVVGPVRTGKSTFISKFMQSSVLSNITNEYEKQRTIDEMPQSGAGKTIMTMQPKFVPSEAVAVDFGGDVSARVRLVDCVGYPIDGVAGFMDEGKPRMVKTLWSDEEMPFEEAAEIGTHKVIAEHSTIAVLVTTDGTITDVPRENYVKAEERVVAELKANGKPFVIVLNSRTPELASCKELATALAEKYEVPVVPLNVSMLEAQEIADLIKLILMEFPVTGVHFNLPKWIMALPYEDELIQNIMAKIKEKTADIVKMSDYTKVLSMFEDDSEMKGVAVEDLNMSNGKIEYSLTAEDSLYYKMISKECGIEIADDFELVKHLKELVNAKNEYDKIKSALDMVKETGYGIVNPTPEDLVLEEPEIVTKNGNSSIKLKATAPSLHIMRVDVATEICPAMGSMEQSGSLATYMINEFENNKQEIWNKNMFGKPMNELVKDSIDSKLAGLPEEVQVKMRKTITKIVNERKGGVICILL